MDFNVRSRLPIEYAGIQSGINQANQIEYQDAQTFSAINQLNNQNMVDYNDLVDNLQEQGREKVKEKQKETIEKVGEYGTAITEKYNEYKEFIKNGGNVNDLLTARLGQNVGGVVGKAGRGVYNTVRTTNEPSDPESFEVQEMPSTSNNRTAFINEGATGEEPFQDENNRPNQTNQPESNPTDTQQPESNQTGSDEADSTREASSNSGENAERELNAGGELEQAGEDASIVGKIGKGIAKSGGALFSATMLGSDVYNQVKNKSFFYGENAGDKVGNFMNELGSAGDLLGVATGDPLLVLAGVGVGAVGGLVSDISELFGHHKSEQAPPPPPPKTVEAPAQINLAGTIGLVQAQPSTLRQISGQ